MITQCNPNLIQSPINSMGYVNEYRKVSVNNNFFLATFDNNNNFFQIFFAIFLKLFYLFIYK